MKQLEELYKSQTGIAILGPTECLFSKMIACADSGYLKKDILAFKADSWHMTSDEEIVPKFIPKNFGHGSVFFELPIKPDSFSPIDITKKFLKDVYASEDHDAFLKNNNFKELERLLRENGLYEFSEQLENHIERPSRIFRVGLNFYTNEAKDTTYVEFSVNPDFKLHGLMQTIEPLLSFIARKFRISNPTVPFVPTELPLNAVMLRYLKFCKGMWDKEASYLASKLLYILDSEGLSMDVPEFLMFRTSGLNVTSQGNNYWQNAVLPREDGTILAKDITSGLRIFGHLNEFKDCIPMEIVFDKTDFSEATLLQPIYSVGIS